MYFRKASLSTDYITIIDYTCFTVHSKIAHVESDQKHVLDFQNLNYDFYMGAKSSLGNHVSVQFIS